MATIRRTNRLMEEAKRVALAVGKEELRQSFGLAGYTSVEWSMPDKPTIPLSVHHV